MHLHTRSSAGHVCTELCDATVGCGGVVAPQRLFWQSYNCLLLDASWAYQSKARAAHCRKHSSAFNTLLRDTDHAATHAAPLLVS